MRISEEMPDNYGGRLVWTVYTLALYPGNAFLN